MSVDGVGHRTFTKVLEKSARAHLSLGDVWSGSEKIWKAMGLSKRSFEARSAFTTRFTPTSYVAYLAQRHISVVTRIDSSFPALLASIEDTPSLLFALGSTKLWNQQSIAIVGTRQPTSYGRTVTAELAATLAQAGYCIVSGWMYGIDAIAHRAVQEVGGATVGVLGSGFDQIMPSSHRRWRSDFLKQGGILVSEYPPWTKPTKGTFPARNRIVAGMSLATVVTEAARGSGALITATLAAEYSRGVCAVPGAIDNPYTEGTMELLNLGARLVRSSSDIIEEAGVVSSRLTRMHRHSTAKDSLEDPLHKQIVVALGVASQAVDELSLAINVPAPKVTAGLTMLELQGIVTSDQGLWSLL